MKNILRKSVSIFLALLVLVSIAPTSVINYVKATGDTIEWTFDGENLVLDGTGELSSAYTSTDEWKNMRDKCVNVTIEGDITIIGDNAFRDFAALETVKASSQITRIGEYAFSGCYNLLEIILPDSVTIIDSYAFSGCSALKEFAFPQNLVKINKWAFKGCNCFDNKPLVLPDTLQKLSLGSFYGADITSLTTPFVGVGPIDWEDSGGMATDQIGYMFGDVSFPNSYPCRECVYGEYYYVPRSLKEVTITKFVESHNFENAKYIEKITVKETAQATSLPTCFVRNCQALKELVIENTDNITWIGSSAFDCCYALENFVIPENVTKIYNRAFALCRFNSITIPEKVEIIGEYAFFRCTNIKSVVIPDSVTSIGDYAFKGCSNLKDVKLPSTYYSIGEGVFDETQYTGTEDDFVITEDGGLVQYRGDDTEVVVPEGVTRLGTAFMGRSDIKSIVLPKGLLYISKNAFKGCSGLTELVIPDTVLEIEYRAFDGCSNIKELVIPDSVVKIHSGALGGLCKLEKLTVPFIGESRDVEGDTREALIGYWFSTSESHNCIYNCSSGGFKEVKQGYSDGWKGYYYRYAYKPRNLVDLTVTDSIIRSNSLNGFELKSLTLGENVKGLEKYAADKSGIEELYIDENIKITEIPDYAFSNNNLTGVTVPGSVKRIGKAFICSNFTKNKITEINLNEGLEVIDGSFAGSKITSIDLPDSLREIKRESFYNCVQLKSVEFPENLTTIGSFAFYYCFALEEVVLSESITHIDGSAFGSCPIKRIVVPESLKSIVEKTFSDCEELEIVVIGGNVEEIGTEAFMNCGSLDAVIIPDSVNSISDDAFKNASEDMVIYCNEGSYAQAYAVQNNIKYTTLVLDAIPNQTYTGKAIEPTVKAKANNKRLVLNKEYKLSFSDNIDVGIASVTARGLGDFKHLIAKGRFNILARQLNNVTVNYEDFACYSPDGTKPEVSLYIGESLLCEGKDYEIIGLEKITGVGTYNLAIKGTGNLSGTKNFTVEVLPRSITEAKVISKDGIEVKYSGYTLVEGVDYRVVKRTTEKGETETYVVGVGNYTDEKRASSEVDSFGSNLLYRLFALFEKILAAFRGVFQ